MNAAPPLVAGVELGGTKCIVTLAADPATIVEQVVLPTSDPVTTLGAVRGHLERWALGHRFAAIGIASFGPLQLDHGRPDYGAIVATTKPGWSGTNLLDALGRHGAAPVGLQTDVNGAALAEGLWGGARGYDDHAYITIGTGVGVGLIVNGRPAGGMAHGEMGHIFVGRAPGDDWGGSCSFHGDCVEGLISGPALAARSGSAGAQLADDDANWIYFRHTLARLLQTVVLTFAPHRIAIGGGVAAGRAWLIPAVRDDLRRNLNGYGTTDRFIAEIDARVGPPGLGDLAGPLGAIAVGLAALAPDDR